MRVRVIPVGFFSRTTEPQSATGRIMAASVRVCECVCARVWVCVNEYRISKYSYPT